MVEPRRFHIVRQIGKGGMGTVYEAVHRQLKYRRAIKVLNPDLIGLKGRFHKEAVQMASCVHAHIVKVWDVDEEEGFGTFIEMDLVDGRSLGDILKNGPLPYLEVLRIGAEITSALDAAHRESIIHRDIKAGNILIETGTGKALLTDFGIAKRLHPDGEETDATSPDMFVGTKRYACPERFLMDHPHPRWDIYGMGAVLYEAFSGHIYLKEFAADQIAKFVLSANFDPRLEYGQTAPEEFDRLVRDCLCREDDRIATASELLRRLEACRDTYLALHADEQTKEARQALRNEIRSKVLQVSALQAQLSDVGASVGDGTHATELRAALREVDDLEDAGRYHEALARLESLSDRAARAGRRSSHIARDEFQRSIDGLAQRWDGLHRHASQWLPRIESAQFEELLARLRRSVADAQWDAAAQDIGDAPSLIARLETVARAAAESKATGILAALETALADLVRVEPSAVPGGADVAALRARVAALMQEQRFDAAVQEAEGVLASVDAARDAAAERVAQHLQAARAEAERAREALDLDAARALAAEELAAAEQAFAAADTGAADPAAAAAQYARAADAYATVATRVAEREEQACAAVADELRAALTASAREADAVVGAARRAAEAALARRADAREAAPTLRAALAALAAARAELPAFGAAEAARTAAGTAAQHASTAAAPRAELRAAEKLVDEAERLFASRHWNEARARYDEAAAAWVAIEQRAAALAEEERRRMLEARCAALREELDSGAGTLDRLAGCAATLAVRVNAATAADVRRAIAEGRDLERAGSLEPALEQLGGARERLAVAEEAYRGALAAGVDRTTTELTARWADLAERAATFVTPALRRQFERHAAAPAASAERGDWERACEALAAARAWLDGCETDLRATAKRALATPMAAFAAAVESLRQGGDEPPAGIDTGHIDAEVDAALAAGEFTAAAEYVDAARREVDSALAEQRRRLTARAAAARASLDQVLEGLDLDAARAVADASVEAGSRARAEAADAARGEDWRSAAAAYERAATAFRAAAEQLAEARRAQIAAGVDAVRNLLQRAAQHPPALVDEAVQAARAALEGVEQRDAAAALAALERSREVLVRTLDDATAFAAAQESRQVAEAAADRLRAIPLTAAEQDAAATALRAATQAFERRAWSDAQAKYGDAQRNLEQLARAAALRHEQEQALAEQRETARAELLAVLGRATDQPDEVVGAVRRAAEELLAASAPAPSDLDRASAALVAAIDEIPVYLVAAERRTEAREAGDRTVLVPRSRRTRKRTEKLLRSADAAMAARQWTDAAARYRDAIRELETPPPVRSPVRWWAGAGAAATALLAALVIWVIRQPHPELPPPSRAVIASASPDPGAVTVNADTAQKFSIELSKGARTDDIEWAFAGKAVPAARGKTAWTFSPDAGDAGKGPYAVAVQVDGGGVPERMRAWTVTVPPVEVVAIPSITAAEPSAADVTVAEGAAQRFAIQVADAGSNPEIDWLFDGKPLSDARGKTTWQYAPDFSAASGPRPLTVRVGSGANAPAHTWNVSVSDANRLPVLKGDPPAGKAVTAENGSTKTFKVTATDEDDDPLSYAWTVDDKPAGTSQPSLDVAVAGDQRVAVAVSDGKVAAPIRLEWPLTAIAPTVKITAQPPSLKGLAFKGSQQFKLVPAAGTSGPLQIAWAVDGQKVSDGPTFVFTADDAGLVRPAPVRIDVTARAANGAEFKHNWRFPVQPPPPRIETATPSEAEITAQPNNDVRFTLDPAAAIGNQSFTYVFSVNGEERPSRSASLDVAVAAGRDYTVTASIRDNYGQRSAERRWNIHGERKPDLDLPKLVQAWLDDYRSALIDKDTARVCSLLALSSEKCGIVGTALKSQDELDVAFNKVKISPSGADTACATYQRRDSFIDPAGRQQVRDTPVSQCFRVVAGKVQLQKSN